MSPGSLNPVRLFFGPIFQMEVRTAGRRTSTYVFRTVFAAVVIFFFAVFLIGNWNDLDMQQSGIARIQQVQNLAPQLAMAILWTQYPALLLLAPIITGPALCDERRQRTLAALLTTPLSAWEIVLGKLSGRLTQALILGAISLPVMLGARLLGGVAAEGILLAVLLTIISVVQIASFALLLSASSSRATSAASSAFILFLFVNFGPILAVQIYNNWIVPDTSLEPISSMWMLALSLPVSLGGVAFEFFLGDSTGVSSTMQLWGWAAIYGAVVTALTVFAAGLRLRATMRQDPDGVEIRKKLKRHNKKRRKAKLPAVAGPSEAEALTPQPSEPIELEESRESRVVSDRPVLWRELRQGVFRRRRMLVISIAAISLGLLLLYINAGFDDDVTHYLVAEIGLGILMLQTVFATTGLIPHERESRTLDVLLTTPLRPRDIVIGKLLGAARRLWLVPLFLLVHFILSTIAGYMHPAALILLPLAWMPAICLLLCAGMLMGVLFRRSITAAIANLAIPITLYVVLPFVLALMESQIWGWRDDTFESLITAMFSVHPFALGAVIIEACELTQWSNNTGDPLTFQMPMQEFNLVEFTIILIVSGSIQVLLGALAIAGAAACLPAREGRSS